MARSLYFRLLFWLLVLLPFWGKAQQCPTASFSIGADTVCVNQPVPITNTSVGASSYEWDFCGGTSGLSNIENLPDYSISNPLYFGHTTAYDTVWHSFLLGFNNNTITRLDYVNGINNTPTSTIINIAGLSGPYDIDIIKEADGTWRGVLVNFFNSSFTRLNFGNSLTNIPSASDPEFVSGLSQIRGVKIVKEHEKYFIVAAAEGSKSIGVIRLGNSLANPILSSNALVKSGLSQSLTGIDIIQHCNKWQGLAGSLNGHLVKIEFGDSLFTEPVITDINKPAITSMEIYDVLLMSEGNNFYGIVPANGNNTFLLNFGSEYSINPTISTLVPFSSKSNMFGMRICKEKGNTYFLSSSIATSTTPLYRARLGINCPVNVYNPTSAQPTISYKTAGKYKVSLFTYGENVAQDSVVVVNSNIKYSITSTCNNPTFTFNSTESCVGASPATYLWDFGDGNTATTPVATHTYATPNQYIATLKITDANNVEYIRQQKILYQSVPPIADFTFNNPVCSGGENIFTDNSISPIDTVVSWHWDLGNNTFSNTKYAAATYLNTGTYNVTLTITTQNGCTSSVTKQVNVGIGPTVKFGYQQLCFGDAVHFTDSTLFPSGTVYLQGSRLWDFGDNTTDTTQNPIHTFAEAKTYTVSLRVLSTDGCVSSFTRNITILPLPTPNFTFPSLVFPNTSVPFTDQSTAVSQTITAWEWNFGDPISGVNNFSTLKNPHHTYSTSDFYTVSLQVTTNQGCKQTITLPIEVLRNCPETSFSLSAHTVSTTENIAATNTTSSGTNSFQWDLCAGDLSQIPVLEQPFNANSFIQNVQPFVDKGKCYLFTPFVYDASTTNPWQRFDFGNSFRNVPTPVFLGNPPNGTTPNMLNKPVCVRLFRKDTAIYGLAINSTGTFTRLFFTDSIANETITASPLSVVGLTKPENMEIVQDGDSLYAFVTCNNGLSGSTSNLLARLSFGTSFLNTPTVTILNNSIIQNNNSGGLLGMSLIRDCNTWYMVVVSNSGKIIRLNFGISLNNTPTYQHVTTQWIAGMTELSGVNSLVKISLHRDMGRIYGLGITKLGTMVNFKFNTMAANPISKQIWASNTFSIFGVDIRDAQFIKTGSEWYGFAAINNQNWGVLKWSFPNPCSTSQPIRQGSVINNFAYQQAGKYYVTLETQDVRGWQSAYADSVTVNTTSIPELNYACPTANFNLPSNVCANQNIDIALDTDTTNQVAWDMCAGDLSENIAFESSTTINNILLGRGISIVKEGNEYFGLTASSYNASSIIFARFGSSFNNSVGIYNYAIGSNNTIFSCNDAKMVRDNGKWIGFLSNTTNYNASSANQIIRLNWNGQDLSSNTPQLSLISGRGLLNNPEGLEVAEENGQKYLFVVNNANNKTIIVYNFGNSYLNTPSVSSFVVDSASSIQRIAFIKDCNRWYGLVSDPQSGTVIKLDFSRGLQNKPTFSKITIGTSKYPTGVKLWRDNGKFYAIVSSGINSVNNIYKINFGDKMANTSVSVTDMGNNGGLANDMIAFDMAQTPDSKTNVIGIAFNNAVNLYKLKFPNPCAIANPIQTNPASTNIAYLQNGNYNVAVTVTDTNGNSYSVGKPIQVKNPVTADFVPSGTFCKGQSIDFTNISNPEPGTQNLAYFWNFADPASGSSNTATTISASHTFAQAGTYNVTLNVSSGAGCNSIKQKAIKIYNPPQADFSFQNSSIGLCANDSIAFTNQSTADVGDQINVYLWEIKDANNNILAVSSHKNPKFLFTNIGTYTATLTVTANGGCANSTTKSVQVSNVGAALSIGVSNDVCEGSMVNYTANIMGSDIADVSWNLGDGIISNDLNPSVVYSSAGMRVVTLQVTNLVGCVTTVSKSITIFARPTAVINTNTAACRNSPLVLSATSSISDGLITNYEWSFGDNTPNLYSSTVSHTYTNVGIYNVRLIITTQYGCKDTSDVVVSVAPSPTAAFIAPSVCVNKPVNFTNQSSSIGGSLTYLWQFRNAANTADLGTSTLANPTFTFTAAGTYPVILTVQDGQCSNTISQNVLIAGLPQASISIEEGCVGTPFIFHDNTTYPTPSDVPVAWFWTITQNTQVVQTMTTQNPQILLPAGTGYSVQMKVFTQKGCESTSPTFSFPVAAPPVANFNVLTTTFTGAPFNVSFQNTSSNAINYLWDFGDGQTSTETNPTHTYAAEGLYIVTLKAIRNACNDTATHSAGVFINITKGVKLSNLSVTGTGSLTIAARIQNESNVELNSLTMQAQTSDGLTINETWTGSLLPNASLVYTFGAKLYVRNDNVVPFVCAETQLLNPTQEITPDNNSACQVLSSNSFLLAVSPVPANQKVNVRYLVAQADEVTIELIDMLGRRVYVQEYGTQAAGKYEQDIDLTQMTTGMYYLRLIVGKQKTGDKISVQH